MSASILCDRVRARNIVNLAAADARKSNLHSVECWLHADENGTFERMAEEIVADTAERAAHLHLSEEAVNVQVAKILVLNALEAAIANKRRRS